MPAGDFFGISPDYIEPPWSFWIESVNRPLCSPMISRLINLEHESLGVEKGRLVVNSQSPMAVVWGQSHTSVQDRGQLQGSLLWR